MEVKRSLGGVRVAKAAPATVAAPLVVVASLGTVATGTGGPPWEIVVGFAERLSGLVGLEVWAFTPSGTGEENGELSFCTMVEDIAAVVADLSASHVVLVGFGVVARAMATYGLDHMDLAGVALFEPSARVEGLREELKDQGVRLSQGGFQGHDLEVYSALETGEKTVNTPWLVVAGTQAFEKYETSMADMSQRSRRAEVHRVGAVGDRLQDDPRTYAILLGWLERVVIPRYTRVEEADS